jgi:hypothetical protein
MASASLVRYLAEAAWLPTALVPSEAVVWQAIDDARARVTLTDRGTSATVDVAFGERGEIERVSANRFRDVHGTPVLTTWAGRFMEYARIDGMMIPTAAEVAWIIAGEPVPVWRGRIVKAEYEMSR